MHTFLGLILIFLGSNSYSQDLVLDLDNRKIADLSAYNNVFLAEELYLAGDSRIVQIDTDLLFEEEGEFKLDLLDGFEPATVKTSQPATFGENTTRWKGEIVSGNPSDSRPLNLTIYLVSYDIDKNNQAISSRENELEFSDAWEVDSSYRVTLNREQVNRGLFVGPPPETSEEVENHKRVSDLKRNSFYSAMASFSVYDRRNNQYKRFRLIPLKYTPKYSVLYELDPARQYPLPPVCDLGHCPDLDLNDYDTSGLEAHQRFIESLPKEDRIVMGDI